MCVIAFAWNAHPRWRLLLVGNRDEFHARPSAPLARWDETPRILGGRDLEAGGTWMGVSDRGRAAVVTNVRDPVADHGSASRGLLVTDYLRGADGARAHVRGLARRAMRYRPFNLLLFDRDDAMFASNHPANRALRVDQGLHGLSNGELDAPWPKIRRGVAALRGWIHAGGDGDFSPLFDAFLDRSGAPDADLPDTGVGLELERRLSPMFVSGEAYGTRATTVIAIAHDGSGCAVERRFGPEGAALGETATAF
jgi:uncharacterized protein with NRDE domain